MGSVLLQLYESFLQYQARSSVGAQRAAPGRGCFQAPNELVALRTGGMGRSSALSHSGRREGLSDVRSSKRRFFTSRNGFEHVAPGRANSSPYKNLLCLACTAIEAVQRLHLDANFDCPQCYLTRGSPSSLSHGNGRGKRGRPPQAAGVMGEGIERQTHHTTFERHQ